MPRFILIDNWLSDASGHNYQYALDVGRAAEERGYEPVMIVRRDLSADIQFPASWRVERVFEFGDSPRHWIGLDGRNPFPCDLEGQWIEDFAAIPWWRRWGDLAATRDRQRRLRSYSQGCEQALTACRPTKRDILFLPSLADFEFLCAARFWRDHPWTKEFDWHLQFHFNFLEGRDPEFAGQAETLRKFQWHFRAAVDQIPEHRLHFYATSPAVARQYDALGIAIFHVLPYPVRKLSDPGQFCGDHSSPATPRAPLRVTRPGGMRQEKGKKQVEQLIGALWDPLLATGKIQLVFQTNAQQLQRRLPSHLHGSVQIDSTETSGSRAPLLTAPHPLDSERYSALICNSDIGLLAYDARRYFSRVSGVLCEMLSAGVPVIVPAGCWLADQLADEQYQHLDGLWRRAAKENSIETTQGRQEFVVNTHGLQRLLLRWEWPEEATVGTYLEVLAESVGSLQFTRLRAVLSERRDGPVTVAFPIPAGVGEMKVTIRNAFGTAAVSIGAVQSIRIAAGEAAIAPTSRVGLIAADEAQIPRLLIEMTEHFAHYRRTACDFAGWWQHAHAPSATVEILESRSGHRALVPRSRVA